MRASPQQLHTSRLARGAARTRELLAVCLFLVGCSTACGAPEEARPDLQSTPQAAPSSPRASSAPRIVCLGDSLTAGLGLPPDDAYPAVLQRRLRQAGYPHEVVNAGVSGDTSAGGLRRVDWSMGENTDVVIVALGANDGLRGLPATELRRNLTAIVERARDRGAAVVLAGMEAPPNFGLSYVREFRQTYVDVARAANVPFVPFLLEGVAGVSALNQADGIHPTAEGQQRIANLLWPKLEPLLEQSSSQ
jgi:acyl-CoA thioesterase-1